MISKEYSAIKQNLSGYFNNIFISEKYEVYLLPDFMLYSCWYTTDDIHKIKITY